MYCTWYMSQTNKFCLYLSPSSFPGRFPKISNLRTKELIINFHFNLPLTNSPDPQLLGVHVSYAISHPRGTTCTTSSVDNSFTNFFSFSFPTAQLCFSTVQKQQKIC